MQRDLAQAAEIQGGMLPARAPEIAGVDLAGFNVPCRTVGGDYYDFFPYADGQRGPGAGRCFGQGHAGVADDDGPPRARPCAGGKPRQPGRFHGAAQQGHLRHLPQQPLHHVLLQRARCGLGRFAVCQCGPQSTGALRASGEAQMLEGGGPVLGVAPVAAYGEQRASLAPGDLLVLYSDGVTEANNPDFDEFGEERFIRRAARKPRPPGEARSSTRSPPRSRNSPPARRRPTISPCWLPSACSRNHRAHKLWCCPTVQRNPLDIVTHIRSVTRQRCNLGVHVVQNTARLARQA